MTLRNEGRHLARLLARLGSEYRHVQQEHDREPVDHPTRRVLEGKLRRIGERFEQLLAQWVQDEELRGRWTQYLRAGGDPPEGPEMAAPPEFKGITDAGSHVEVRAGDDGGYDVVVDGRVESHEFVPWYLEPDMIEPIRIGDHTCREVFDAPAEAVRALSTFLDTPGSAPPWAWGRALLEDGLIDDNFGLTPRGRRRLGKVTTRPGEGPARTTYGVLAADTARARLFVLHAEGGAEAPTLAPLVEVSQSTDPDQRARDSEVFADTRPGLRREGPHGPRHGVSDRREGHRREVARRFAAHVVEEAGRVWREHGVSRAVVVASPEMLGVLRAVSSNAGAQPWSVQEEARDLSRLSAPALHDALADDGLLPPRARLSPTRPQPGVPI